MHVRFGYQPNTGLQQCIVLKKSEVRGEREAIPYFNHLPSALSNAVFLLQLNFRTTKFYD